MGRVGINEGRKSYKEGFEGAKG